MFHPKKKYLQPPPSCENSAWRACLFGEAACKQFNPSVASRTVEKSLYQSFELGSYQRWRLGKQIF